MKRLEQLITFLENEPDDPFLNYALAMEYEGQGEPQKALEILRSLKKNNPEYLATYYHLGRLVEEQEGNRELALEILQEGMVKTRTAGKQHMLAELQSAYNNLLYDE